MYTQLFIVTKVTQVMKFRIPETTDYTENVFKSVFRSPTDQDVFPSACEDYQSSLHPLDLQQDDRLQN